MDLKNSKTAANLKAAFAGESQANRRYLYFAQKADIEGHSDISAVFRSTAEGETGHAHGHLEYLEEVGDPATDMPFGSTAENLVAAVAGETHEYTDIYPGMARTAVRKALTRSRIGSRPSPRRKNRTQGAFSARSISSPELLTIACGGGGERPAFPGRTEQRRWAFRLKRAPRLKIERRR